MSDIGYEENLPVYKSIKSVSWIFCNSIWIPCALFGKFVLFQYLITNAFFDGVMLDSYKLYTLTCLFSCIFSPLIIYDAVFVLFNTFTITKHHIIIENSLLRKYTRISIHDVVAFESFINNARITTYHFVKLYLRNGQRVHSGSLCLSQENFNALEKTLLEYVRCNLKFKDKKKWRSSQTFEYCPYVKRHILSYLISLAPFVVGISMILMLILNVNLIGEQKPIYIEGIVLEKHVNTDSNKEIEAYELEIKDSRIEITYNVEVSEAIYNSLSKNDHLVIHAKKGRLGIVYDIFISKR